MGGGGVLTGRAAWYGPGAGTFEGRHSGFLRFSSASCERVRAFASNPAPANDCSGSFAYDMNARIQSGIDSGLVVGASVYCQYWTRDPADPFTLGLTDGVSFVIGD